MNLSMQRRGFDELQAKLNKGRGMRPFEGAMRESLKVLQQEASRFPPQPSRTRAKTFNTWIREVGQANRASFGISRKSGKPTIKSAGRKIYRVSEQLLKKWKEAQPQVRVGGGYIVGRITNKASYGQFVQGARQARFHAQTPWKTTAEIQQMHLRRIVAIFERALKRAWQ